MVRSITVLFVAMFSASSLHAAEFFCSAGNVVRPQSSNPESRGRLPVAIPTSELFDAATVAPNTVRFGATGAEIFPLQFTLTDVDCDQDQDMVLHFETQKAGIEAEIARLLLPEKPRTACRSSVQAPSKPSAVRKSQSIEPGSELGECHALSVALAMIPLGGPHGNN